MNVETAIGTRILALSAVTAIVSTRVFEVVRQRSPNIWRSLRQIHTSKPIPINLFVTFGSLDAGDRAAMLDSVLVINTSEEGRSAKDIVRIDSVVHGSWSDAYPEIAE